MIISKDSFEQCYTPETAARFVLQIGNLGDQIEDSKLTPEAYEEFLYLMSSEFAIRFASEEELES